MSDVITNNDVADVYDALGWHGAAATLRHFEQPASPVSWTAEIDALSDERDALQTKVEQLEALLCKRCIDKWENRSNG